MCFPIPESVFSLHLSLLVPSAPPREEEACLLFYGGNTDEPFKILRNIYIFLMFLPL